MESPVLRLKINIFRLKCFTLMFLQKRKLGWLLKLIVDTSTAWGCVAYTINVESADSTCQV